MPEGKNRTASDEEPTVQDVRAGFSSASPVVNLEGEKTLPLNDLPSHPFPATMIDNRFEIISEIGRGGIGIAYLANDRGSQNRPVVIKALLEQPDPNEKQWVERHFREEIKALSRIDHPGIVKLVTSGEMPDGRPYIAMEFVEGTTLRSQIQPEVGLGEARRVANFISRLGQAISAAHDAGVYHRDLKPENILLCAKQTGEENEEQVKVIDFGISIVKDSLDEKTRSTIAAGSIRYMAPEQLSGKATKLSDIYAMGLIAYEVITGRLPFNTEEGSRLIAAQRLVELQAAGVRVKARDLRPTISLAADEAILKALSYNPGKRFQRADDFGQELANALLQERQTDPREQSDESSRMLEMAYVLFMDIAGYSTLPIDVQTRCLEDFQYLVKETRAFRKAISTDRLISLPTDDGIALAFFGDPIAPVQCAVQTSLALKQYPHIELRMGINAGPVYRINDINSNRNIAGGGLHLAKRVMDYGDSGHILLSQSIADVVSQFSEWKTHLHDIGEHPVANNASVHLFNLHTGDAGNSDLPSKLRTPLTVAGESNREASSGTTYAARPGENTRRWSVIFAIAGLVVALAGVGWWYKIGGRNVSGAVARQSTDSESNQKVRTLSYWAVLQPYRNKKPFGDPIELTGGIAGETYFNSGDRIRFVVTSADDGYVYMINEESPDKYNVIFPSPEANGQSSRVKANAVVSTSECSFDRKTGTEKVWIVWSVEAIEELEESVRRWGNSADQGEIKEPRAAESVSKLFQDGPKMLVESDTANKRLNLHTQGDVLVYALKLIHR